MSDKEYFPGFPVINEETKITDIDLEKEEFNLRDGRRLTEELAEEIAERTLQNIRAKNLIPGGKSLNGDGSHSPVLQVRLPTALKLELQEKAKHEKRSASAVAREAIEKYLAS